MPYDDSAWLRERIERTRELIIAHENAIEALIGGAQSYLLDTGQTRQSVTRAELAQLKSGLLSLENRLVTLQARLYGAGIHARPGY